MKLNLCPNPQQSSDKSKCNCDNNSKHKNQRSLYASVLKPLTFYVAISGNKAYNRLGVKV